MMMDDVCTALHWVRDHRAELCAPGAPPARRLVFGGYSSGAHVAASLLQRPDLLAARGLPPPEKLCDGVLYISGVLAVRPSADPAGPPAPAPGATPAGAARRRRNPLRPALTDAISRLSFGGGAASLPSPVERTAASPRLPHLLIGCEREVFGLPYLEGAMRVFFAQRQFHERLVRRGVRSTLVDVDSNHWSILSSKGLRDALRDELAGLAPR